jgi:hypothetical protein
MATDEAKYEERRKKAIARYRIQVDFYERTKSDARWKHYALQSVVIIATAITPFMIIASAPIWLQALTPALATISLGIDTLFKFHESWVRRARTVETLKREFHFFDTRSGKDYAASIPDDEALDRFIDRTEQASEGELGEWEHSRLASNKPTESKTPSAP